jgi:phosphate transport system substrate-binding protein
MLLFRSRVVAYGLLSAVVGPALLAADTITAAGATFPFPLYSKWFQQYKDKTGIQINYQSIGSGGGIKQLTQGTVDFGASDKPMSDAQLAKVKIKPLHFPTVMGAVVPVFNVPGVTGDLKFTGAILAGIFMGTIKKWNDQAITNVNKGAKLPDEYIVVIVRSDASGTTFVFTDYLSKANAAWKSKVGADSAINWPTGLRAKGNEGVSGFVKQTPFSIGYVELNYARQQKMGYGSVQNLAGTFVKADLASVTAAAASAAQDMPADYRVSITNAPGADAYPISTYTWLLIPSRIQDQAKRKAISEFLTWMLTTGQKTAPLLDYAPLPKSVADREAKAVSSIQ